MDVSDTANTETLFETLKRAQELRKQVTYDKRESKKEYTVPKTCLRIRGNLELFVVHIMFPADKESGS